MPAYYEMDTLFGKAEDPEVGPTTWIGLQGAVCLVEPDRFDNILQIGLVLADTLTNSMRMKFHYDDECRPGGRNDLPFPTSLALMIALRGAGA